MVFTVAEVVTVVMHGALPVVAAKDDEIGVIKKSIRSAERKVATFSLFMCTGKYYLKNPNFESSTYLCLESSFK